jgi:hypothetical protein
MSGPKRASGPRSNMYSENKFSNWARFDPFAAEAYRVSEEQKPRATIHIDPDQIIHIYESPLHQEFVRPFSVDDVRQILSEVPMKYLQGLAAVFLLGGSTKQLRSRRINRYGMYSSGRIYLCPIAQSSLIRRLDHAPKPSVVREYTRYGASFSQEEGKWILQFSAESLRMFVLFDVLLHEIGHHVERLRSSQRSTSESFANWFAEYQSIKLLNKEN